MTNPKTMKAVAISSYGGPEKLEFTEVPIPNFEADEVLIEVVAAGVGVWDVGERSGAMAGMLPDSAKRFPRRDRR